MRLWYRGCLLGGSESSNWVREYSVVSEIDIEIDGLHSSVLHRSTAEVLATQVVPYQELTELQRHKAMAWQFDWETESKRRSSEVFALFVNGSELVQGLVCVEDTGDHVFVHLIESAPHNVGEQKLYQGVAGNCFAFACGRSFQLGYNGYISFIFIAKSNLIDHYTESLGAQQFGSSQRMIIDTAAAGKLYSRYATENDKWPS